jgi:translation initiation factor RLI1
MPGRVAVIDRDSCRGRGVVGYYVDVLCPLVRNKIEAVKVDDKGRPCDN